MMMRRSTNARTSMMSSFLSRSKMKLPMAFVLLSAAARATVVSAFSVRTAAVSCSSRSLSGSCHRPSSATAAAATSLFSGTANPTSPTTTLFGLRTPSRLFSTAADEATEEKETGAVPITLLAGFLGSGKTTALKNLLENRDGIKVGVIVNDVAAVNIDAKLLANPGNDGEAPSSADRVDAGTAIETDFGGTVELQNGCACCSLADELLTSVETLMDGRDFDAVVVELSGVADPVAVKQNWDMARMNDHPATKLANVNRVVTVVDSSTFGTDWMTWDSAGDRDSWTEEGDDCAGQRKVPELLAEQVEAADLLIVNKIDLAGPEQMKTATAVALAINDDADVIEAEFGRVKPSDILGSLEKLSGSAATVVEKEEKKAEEEASSGHSHSHDHDCTDKDCTDSSHSHDHGEHDAAACSDPDCTDSSHSHSHSHDEHDAATCNDPGCTEDHSHSHDHGESSCNDPDCTDMSHSHSHSHDTSTDRLGISNFVYKSTVPFNSQRLLMLLNRWPVPIKEELDIIQLEKASKDGAAMGDDKVEDSPFAGVLRSKGFCWLSPIVWSDTGGDAWRHDTAMYWSHAGKHFGINTAGKWWGTIPKDTIKDYFVGNMKEYERIMREDWASEEWGDRRQELVFIGAGIDEEAITKALDDCLMTDEEMAQYRADLQNYELKTMTAMASGGPSLFDAGGYDNIDVEK